MQGLLNNIKSDLKLGKSLYLSRSSLINDCDFSIKMNVYVLHI